MNQKSFREVVQKYTNELERSTIPYQFIEETALILQGVSIEHENQLIILIQWDLLESVYEKYEAYSPSEIKKDQFAASFTFYDDNYHIQFRCVFNTTVKTDPYRIKVDVGGTEVWCKSLYAYIYDDRYYFSKTRIEEFLLEKQHDMTSSNEQAWNQNNFQALIQRFGEPEHAADKIKQNPDWRLHPYRKYLGDLSSKRVIHLLGSNGVKGVAMALLGADVTIVDFSKENQKYAKEVAKAADSRLNYILSDALSLPMYNVGEFDIVLMELGVLHYFVDLKSLAVLIRDLLNENGKFILHEFHPISTKLITSSGKKHKVTGNYFDPSIKTLDVAFTKHMPEENKQDLAKVYQRQWTIGEVVTILADAGLFIEVLEEEPNHKVHDMGLPKTYTMVLSRR
ncbi:class I SAM-dependent methyltransferase [Litchfieldia alkalitelluris]|uniref:class I SAM-dependent methyltransferase n=1 Tax=Litchfieldia alkalitelluris TaxID=304268 RepID=UPI001F30B185|nr:class I SAM-dependent methyltransferase [Litchfieldia alkalitelluris]